MLITPKTHETRASITVKNTHQIQLWQGKNFKESVLCSSYKWQVLQLKIAHIYREKFKNKLQKDKFCLF